MSLRTRLTIITLSGVIIIVVIIGIISKFGQKTQLPSTGLQATTPPVGSPLIVATITPTPSVGFPLIVATITPTPSVGSPLIVAAITPTRANYLPFVMNNSAPTATPTATYTLLPILPAMENGASWVEMHNIPGIFLPRYNRPGKLNGSGTAPQGVAMPARPVTILPFPRMSNRL